MADDLAKFKVEIVTPERLFCQMEADMVTVPGQKGEFGVLAKHIPLVSALHPGIVHIYDNEKILDTIFVSGGFAEVNDNGGLTILSEQVLHVRDIDLKGTAERLKQAQAELAEIENHDTHEAKELLKATKLLEAMCEAGGKA